MPTVVKLGGSLLDLPDLSARLREFLPRVERPILVVGGGAAADAVRMLDRTHGLGDERSHWLALRAAAVNARAMEGILPSARVVADKAACWTAWRGGSVPVVDPFDLLLHHDAPALKPALPRTWDATTDSVAARAARLLGAGAVMLLKSVGLPEGAGLDHAAADGLVDPVFAAQAVGLRVSWVNFRERPATVTELPPVPPVPPVPADRPPSEPPSRPAPTA